MFSKLSVVVTSVLITLAAATTIPVTPPTSDQCCQSVVDSSSLEASKVLSALDINLGGVNVPIGLSCSPITILGNNCIDITTRCDAPEMDWGGLLAINCIPITL
ncbi:hydrophobin 2 [Favolaschia claudopus]|uniref:Hydrophobin n=1 Tax=Favolaschia claudopus TaxID=2862362 RepID=A0AAW0CZI4_9AGAR